ncbi:MAG: nucleotidyltransferase [Blastopirellula sp.]|nr:MAG: nucleotidyltransferase [Blastopirellula sp.]
MTKTIDNTLWKNYIDTLELTPLFVTVSGAHLYGFPSIDSDVDLRGTHLLPLDKVIGLTVSGETFEASKIHQGIEVDLVSHDVHKYFQLLVKNNGYILEQVFSPLVIQGQSFLDRLKPIAGRCITKHHYHHYRGFYGTQRKLIEKQEEKTVKAVLYAYRVLMTGIHLLNTGRVEANVLLLNQEFQLTFMDELIEMKKNEKIAPKDLDWNFHAGQLELLEAKLDQAFESSSLPEDRDRAAVNDFLIDLRINGV